MRPETDLRELFARMCFNATVSNLDDHPRNHAILAKGRSWQLSPAFDLTPTPMIATERRDPAMACGTAGRYANRRNLLASMVASCYPKKTRHDFSIISLKLHETPGDQS